MFSRLRSDGRRYWSVAASDESPEDRIGVPGRDVRETGRDASANENGILKLNDTFTGYLDLIYFYISLQISGYFCTFLYIPTYFCIFLYVYIYFYIFL